MTLLERVKGDVASSPLDNLNTQVPIDLVTTSASGIDPHITPAAAEFQLARIARIRGIRIEQLRALVAKHTQGRQFGILGEPRVNVVELHLDLDRQFPSATRAKLE